MEPDAHLPFPDPDEPEGRSSPLEASPEEVARRREAQKLSAVDTAVGYVGIEQARIELEAGKAVKTNLPRACPKCGRDIANVVPKGNQLVAHCATCGTYVYNVPRWELGLAPRPVRDPKSNLSPKDRARILARDRGRCVLCGRAAADGVELTVDHLLSVQDGEEMHADPDLLNDDLNLAAMCAECQLGKGRYSIPVATYIGLLLLHAERARRDGASLEPVFIDPPSND